jgi:two-component sensor histidine kinase
LTYQRALAAVSRIAAGAIPPDRLMQQVTAQVARVTQIRHVKILRYRADVGDLLVVAGVGWKEGVVGHATLAADNRSPAGRSIQTGAPVSIVDLPNDPEYRYSDLLREHGVVSVLNVPVTAEGRTWGVLEVDSEEMRSFDEIDTGALAIFANVIGLAFARHEAEARATEVLADNARRLTRADVLLRELQHRVKNNFQVIIGMLGLQRSRASSSETKDRLTSVMERIFAIALAHDQLSMREGGSTVDFRDYLRALCANIDPARPGLTILVEAENAMIPLDRAVPAGLVVNELVTNAVKYAFGDGGGTIRVVFQTRAEIGEGCIAVEDDGKGIGQPKPGGGHGRSLIESLADQLGGRVEYLPGDVGTRAILCFPIA